MTLVSDGQRICGRLRGALAERFSASKQRAWFSIQMSQPSLTRSHIIAMELVPVDRAGGHGMIQGLPFHP